MRKIFVLFALVICLNTCVQADFIIIAGSEIDLPSGWEHRADDEKGIDWYYPNDYLDADGNVCAMLQVNSNFQMNANGDNQTISSLFDAYVDGMKQSLQNSTSKKCDLFGTTARRIDGYQNVNEKKIDTTHYVIFDGNDSIISFGFCIEDGYAERFSTEFDQLINEIAEAIKTEVTKSEPIAPLCRIETQSNGNVDLVGCYIVSNNYKDLLLVLLNYENTTGRTVSPGWNISVKAFCDGIRLDDDYDINFEYDGYYSQTTEVRPGTELPYYTLFKKPNGKKLEIELNTITGFGCTPAVYSIELNNNK